MPKYLKKKHYLSIFPSKKYFEKQLLSYSQTFLKEFSAGTIRNNVTANYMLL
jgi:hypothetical protein